MTTRLHAFYLIAALLVAIVPAQAEIILDEFAIEADIVRVIDGGGGLEARSCITCPVTRVRFGANSRVFLDGDEITPSQLPPGRMLGLVIYTAKDHEVTQAKLVRSE